MPEDTKTPGWNDWDKKPKKKRGVYKTWEDEIIRADWQTHTDEEIARKIGRPIKSIERRRKILGFTKPNGRPAAALKKEAIVTNPTEYNLSKLSKDDRISFYKTKFTENPRYKWLLKVLMADEIEYYQHKYIETMDSLDSITMQEEDLLHNMIMKDISIMRLQSRIKQQETAWNEADDENKPPMNMGLYRDLNDAEKQYISYQEKLKLTREQRLKTDREEKVTITAIVRAFLDSKNKERAGVMAGQMVYSTNKCREDMTRMNFLLGG